MQVFFRVRRLPRRSTRRPTSLVTTLLLSALVTAVAGAQNAPAAVAPAAPNSPAPQGGPAQQDAPAPPAAPWTAEDGGGIEWLGGAPPPAPEELARNPAAFEDLLTENGLSLDLEGGSVAVRGGTLHDQTTLGYPIEYLVVTDRGRTHEALFVVKTQPSLLDACLRALGLRPGTPMRFRLKEDQPSQEEIDAGTASPWDPVPSSGPLVAIDVSWTDDAGRQHRTSLESLLVDGLTGEPLPEEDWVYTGSAFGTLRQGRRDVQAFVADLQGDVVAIYLTGQGAALLERNSIDGVDDARYLLNADTMPSRGTPVTMHFSRTGRSTAPSPSRATAPVVAGDTGAKLDDFLTHLVPWGFSGVVAVQRGNELLLHKGYGLADRETGLAVDTGSVFPLSSLSKQFTAALILRLAADGKLDLDDIISRSLRRVPEDKAGITVRQLLQHTSGLPEDSASAATSADRSAAVAAVLASPLLAEPGTAFSYSNAGYVLLAAIAEEAAGATYRSLLAEHILGPANMIDTGLFGEPMWDGSQLVHGYQDGADALAEAVARHGLQGTALGRDVGTPAKGALAWNRLGAGAAVATVRDVLRWENALRDGKIIPAESLAVMFTPGLDHYGTAWWIEPTAHGRLAWHDGIMPGFRIEVQRYLDEDLTVIVAANAEINSVAYPVAAIAFGQDVPLPPQVEPTLPPPPAGQGAADQGTSGARTLDDTLGDTAGARGELRNGVAEALKLAGDYADGVTQAPLFTLRAIGDELFLVASAEAVYEQLGPAFGFRAATLKDRMSRRGGLRLRPVHGSGPASTWPLEWEAFEASTLGTVLLRGSIPGVAGCTAGVTLSSGDAAADAAPLLSACRTP